MNKITTIIARSLEFDASELWEIDDEIKIDVSFNIFWSTCLISKEITSVEVKINRIRTSIGDLNLDSMNNRFYLQLVDKLKSKSYQLIDDYLIEKEMRARP